MGNAGSRRRVGLGIGIALAVSASVPAEDLAARKDSTAAQAAPVAGLVAIVDPATGELVEAAAPGTELGLGDALSTSSDGLVPEELPDGSVRVHLEGRFRHVAFATVDAAGRVAVSHQAPVTGSEAAPIEAPGCVESEAPRGGDDDASR